MDESWEFKNQLIYGKMYTTNKPKHLDRLFIEKDVKS